MANRWLTWTGPESSIPVERTTSFGLSSAQGPSDLRWRYWPRLRPLRVASWEATSALQAPLGRTLCAVQGGQQGVRSKRRGRVRVRVAAQRFRTPKAHEGSQLQLRRQGVFDRTLKLVSTLDVPRRWTRDVRGPLHTEWPKGRKDSQIGSSSNVSKTANSNNQSMVVNQWLLTQIS